MNNSTKNSYPINFSIIMALMLFILGGNEMNAQITINKNIFTKLIGKTFREVLYETDLDIDPQLADIKAAVGPDQIWDFSGFNYIDSTVVIYEVMNVDPADPILENPELANSQHVSKITTLPGSGGVMDTTTTYIYSSLENDEWLVYGSFTVVDLDNDGTLDSVVQFLVPPNLEVAFPVTMNSEWFDSTNLVTVFDGMEFVSSIFIDSTWVEGYGTVITPYGSAEALRVHRKNLTKNPFLPTIVDESNDLEFVTEDDIISASIVVEDGRAFYSVRKEVGTTSTIDPIELKFSVNQVSPNPFSEQLDVRVNVIEAGEIRFQLVGTNGNKVSQLRKEYMPVGEQNIQLELDDVPSGMYYLQVRSGSLVQHVPVVKL